MGTTSTNKTFETSLALHFRFFFYFGSVPRKEQNIEIMIKFLSAAVIVGFVLAGDAARLNQAKEAPAKTANKSASMEKRQDGMCLGGDSCCTWSKHKCGEGEGDCDWGFECKKGLVCGSNNCRKFGKGFDSTDDCCEKRTGCSGGDSCCTNGNCQRGEGDCDWDGACAEGLVCGSNNCRRMNGQRWKSFDWDDDCCE